MTFEDFHRERTPTPERERGERLASFARQWDHPTSLALGDESFDVYDMRPETERSDVPVAVMPGWNHTPEVWRENARVLYENDRRVVMIDAPHGAEPSIRADDIPNAELRRVSAFLDAIKSRGIEKTDALGHSEGAIDVLLAAQLEPELFRTLVLANPGGLIGADSFVDLTRRFLKDKALSVPHALREGTFAQLRKSSWESARSMVPHPIRSTQETSAIANADLAHLLRGLKEKGINIIIVHGADDPVFPFLRMAQTIGTEKGKGDITRMLDGVYSVAGGHEDIIRKPDAYMLTVEGGLSAIEARDEKREAV